MSRDYAAAGFRLEPLELPCCGARATLDELRYDWPQAFGRFDLSVGNPGVDAVSTDSLEQVSKAIGTSLRVIRRRI
jgi:hypothetical protein